MSLLDSATVVRGEVLYEPTPESTAGTQMAEFLSSTGHLNYLDLWRWSVDQPDQFWRQLIDWAELEIDDLGDILGDATLPGAEWLPGARLSYPEHALRHESAGPALVGVSQTRPRTQLSMGELRANVARCRQGLRQLGVRRGDRVVAYLPNIPETVVAFLATASLGAVWASCPPEFGAKAVVDRFAQLDPVVLLGIDGYAYGAKTVDRRDVFAAIRKGLPTVRHTVVLDYLGLQVEEGAIAWTDLTASDGPLEFERVPFDHPLYVLFSSGTTGLPKAIVHGHGGILLEHTKALGLHNDVRPGDRFFWQSTTGWMVWNYAVSALLRGATMVCFDGHPAYPGPDALWQLVAEEEITYFGTSAGHLISSAASSLPSTLVDRMSSLRGIGSTGAPLAADGFRWVNQTFGQSVLLSSVSGGTDICSGFVGGSWLSPVRAGEISAPMLGCDVVSLDPQGRVVFGEFGELSVRRPMPSMPVGLWGDLDGSRLLNTYFSQHLGVWSHGDWVLFHGDLSCVITGRSDATLNRGGVRLGTADFYSVLDTLEGVDDSLVVHLEDHHNGELILLVATSAGARQWSALVRQIRATLRSELSPRHVPDRVIRLNRLPRTLTGKRLEQPVKKILLGADPDSVVSRDSITSPEALDGLRLSVATSRHDDPVAAGIRPVQQGAQ